MPMPGDQRNNRSQPRGNPQRQSIVQDLLDSLPDGRIIEVRVGCFWTAVVAKSGDRQQCGLASTLRIDTQGAGRKAAVGDAGLLSERSARELAELAHSDSIVETAIGMAAINALLPLEIGRVENLNAEDVIARHGIGKRVVIIGHFPFVPRLRERLRNLDVLELHPRSGDLPADAATEVIPRAAVLAVTGTTLLNHTFEKLMALRHPDALVLVLGPTTPLSPVMFEHGAHVLCGAVVEDMESVLHAVCQGANFRQIHRRGVRLVTLRN